jgi:hypothetical protein
MIFFYWINQLVIGYIGSGLITVHLLIHWLYFRGQMWVAILKKKWKWNIHKTILMCEFTKIIKCILLLYLFFFSLFHHYNLSFWCFWKTNGGLLVLSHCRSFLVLTLKDVKLKSMLVTPHLFLHGHINQCGQGLPSLFIEQCHRTNVYI